jgi:hypothetical protein
MTIRYAVTYEFETRPPVTHTGTVAGSQVATCARRAIEEAQLVLRPVNWSSMVFVVLERAHMRAEHPPAEQPDMAGVVEE